MPPSFPDPSSARKRKTTGLSAGFAGAAPEVARDNWAEDSRHRLTGPGAYEWWYFHALSPTGDGILISLFEGLPFHPRYLTQINRYAERLGGSLQKPWPGLDASRYPAAYVAVYKAGKRVAQFLNLYPPDSSQSTLSDLQIGPNRVTIRQDGSIGIVVKGYPFHTSHGRPRTRADQVLSATLTFTPTFKGVQHTRPFRAPDRTGATHHWVLAAPHGRMAGSALLIENAQQEPESLFEMELDTLAYHDHVYGQGGLATGVKTLLWGFIQGDTWTAAWHQSLTHTAARHQADGLIFFEKNQPPVVVDSPDSRLAKFSYSHWLLKHPGRVALHGSDTHGHPLELVLNHTAVLENAPFHTRLAAQGTVSLPGRVGPALVGRGTTHVLKLHRLRWPVLSDLTLLAITSIARDDPLWSE